MIKLHIDYARKQATKIEQPHDENGEISISCYHHRIVSQIRYTLAYALADRYIWGIHTKVVCNCS